MHSQLFPAQSYKAQESSNRNLNIPLTPSSSAFFAFSAAKFLFIAACVNSRPVTAGYFFCGPYFSLIVALPPANAWRKWTHLDHGVGARLVEERHAIPRPVVVDAGLRGRLDAVEGRFEAVVGPAWGVLALKPVFAVQATQAREGRESKETYDMSKSPILHTISPGVGSTFVHTLCSEFVGTLKLVLASLPGQISSPLWPARWYRSVMKSQSTCAPGER
jgi:hypothetical protein